MRLAISIVAVGVPLLLAVALVMLWLASPEYDLEFLLGLLAAGGGCLALGPIFASLRTWKPQRAVFWASLVAFGLTISFGALLATSRAPFTWNFRAVQGDFEHIRDQVLSGSAPKVPVKFGRFRVQAVRRVGDAVFFVLWRNPDTETGIVWSQIDPPPLLGPRMVRASSHSVTSSWHTFSQSND